MKNFLTFGSGIIAICIGMIFLVCEFVPEPHNQFNTLMFLAYKVGALCTVFLGGKAVITGHKNITDTYNKDYNKND